MTDRAIVRHAVPAAPTELAVFPAEGTPVVVDVTGQELRIALELLRAAESRRLANESVCHV